jgi:hypothetical protein
MSAIVTETTIRAAAVFEFMKSSVAKVFLSRAENKRAGGDLSVGDDP